MKMDSTEVMVTILWTGMTWYAQLSEWSAEIEMESGLGLETFKKTTV